MLSSLWSGMSGLQTHIDNAFDNNEGVELNSHSLYSGYDIYSITNTFEAKAFGLSLDEVPDFDKLKATRFKMAAECSYEDLMLSFYYFYREITNKYTNYSAEFEDFRFEIFVRFLYNFYATVNSSNFQSNKFFKKKVISLFNELKLDQDSLELVLEIDNIDNERSKLDFYFYFAAESKELKDKFKNSLIHYFDLNIIFVNFKEMSTEAQDLFFLDAAKQFKNNNLL